MRLKNIVMVLLLAMVVTAQAHGACVSDFCKSAIAYKSKNKSYSENTILDHLAENAQYRFDNNQDVPEFSGKALDAEDISTLLDAGFSSDFLSRLQGTKQYVTVGLTPLVLLESTDMVVAPVARIFLTPRSFYKPREPLFTTKFFNNRKWWIGQTEKLDLSLGYTVVKTKVADKSTNYALAGLSFEINRSALVSFGIAFSVNTVDEKKRQAYVGITLDQNILKEIGLIAKN